MTTKRLTGMALLVALGTLSGFLAIPVGGARILPAQHAINVVAAALFGPGPAVLIAFVVALLRNLLGLGTLFAFPGGMFGALIAGLSYKAIKRHSAAAAGEVFGTGVVGALAAFPLARFVLGMDVVAISFILPFAMSSLAGATAGLVVLKVVSLSWQKQTERA